MTTTRDTSDTVATIFGRLFENEFATLDGIAISCRHADGMDYADGTSGLSRWLGDEPTQPPAAPADPAAHAVHAACHAAMPHHEAVISGWSRHLRALLLEGLGPPPSTSMMRNRGVPDISAHLVGPEALRGSALADTIDEARRLAERNGMRHLLVVTTDALVVVSGGPPFEAMAHWHNVEFAARVECMRIEEADVHLVSAEARERQPGA